MYSAPRNRHDQPLPGAIVTAVASSTGDRSQPTTPTARRTPGHKTTLSWTSSPGLSSGLTSPNLAVSSPSHASHSHDAEDVTAAAAALAHEAAWVSAVAVDDPGHGRAHSTPPRRADSSAPSSANNHRHFRYETADASSHTLLSIAAAIDDERSFGATPERSARVTPFLETDPTAAAATSALNSSGAPAATPSSSIANDAALLTNLSNSLHSYAARAASFTPGTSLQHQLKAARKKSTKKKKRAAHTTSGPFLYEESISVAGPAPIHTPHSAAAAAAQHAATLRLSAPRRAPPSLDPHASQAVSNGSRQVAEPCLQPHLASCRPSCVAEGLATARAARAHLEATGKFDPRDEACDAPEDRARLEAARARQATITPHEQQLAVARLLKAAREAEISLDIKRLARDREEMREIKQFKREPRRDPLAALNGTSHTKRLAASAYDPAVALVTASEDGSAAPVMPAPWRAALASAHGEVQLKSASLTPLASNAAPIPTPAPRSAIAIAHSIYYRSLIAQEERDARSRAMADAMHSFQPELCKTSLAIVQRKERTSIVERTASAVRRKSTKRGTERSRSGVRSERDQASETEESKQSQHEAPSSSTQASFTFHPVINPISAGMVRASRPSSAPRDRNHILHLIGSSAYPSPKKQMRAESYEREAETLTPFSPTLDTASHQPNRTTKGYRYQFQPQTTMGEFFDYGEARDEAMRDQVVDGSSGASIAATVDCATDELGTPATGWSRGTSDRHDDSSWSRGGTSTNSPTRREREEGEDLDHTLPLPAMDARRMRVVLTPPPGTNATASSSSEHQRHNAHPLVTTSSAATTPFRSPSTSHPLHTGALDASSASAPPVPFAHNEGAHAQAQVQHAPSPLRRVSSPGASLTPRSFASTAPLALGSELEIARSSTPSSASVRRALSSERKTSWTLASPNLQAHNIGLGLDLAATAPAESLHQSRSPQQASVESESRSASVSPSRTPSRSSGRLNFQTVRGDQSDLLSVVDSSSSARASSLTRITPASSVSPYARAHAIAPPTGFVRTTIPDRLSGWAGRQAERRAVEQRMREEEKMKECSFRPSLVANTLRLDDERRQIERAQTIAAEMLQAKAGPPVVLPERPTQPTPWVDQAPAIGSHLHRQARARQKQALEALVRSGNAVGLGQGARDLSARRVRHISHKRAATLDVHPNRGYADLHTADGKITPSVPLVVSGRSTTRRRVAAKPLSMQLASTVVASSSSVIPFGLSASSEVTPMGSPRGALARPFDFDSLEFAAPPSSASASEHPQLAYALSNISARLDSLARSAGSPIPSPSSSLTSSSHLDDSSELMSANTTLQQLSQLNLRSVGVSSSATQSVESSPTFPSRNFFADQFIAPADSWAHERHLQQHQLPANWPSPLRAAPEFTSSSVAALPPPSNSNSLLSFASFAPVAPILTPTVSTASSSVVAHDRATSLRASLAAVVDGLPDLGAMLARTMARQAQQQAATAADTTSSARANQEPTPFDTPPHTQRQRHDVQGDEDTPQDDDARNEEPQARGGASSSSAVELPTPWPPHSPSPASTEASRHPVAAPLSPPADDSSLDESVDCDTADLSVLSE